MPVQTRVALQGQATLVRDESVTAANTATRVGGTLLDIVDSAALLSDLASIGGVWVESSGTVSLANLGHDVAIGAAAMVGSERLRVVGESRFEGNVALPGAAALVVGDTPADGGSVRIPKNSFFMARNTANGGNVVLVEHFDTDVVTVGAQASFFWANRAAETNIVGNTKVTLRTGAGDERVTVTPNTVTVTGQPLADLASTETPDLLLSLARTVNFAAAGGTITQRAVKVTAPTYTADAALTMAVAATVAIAERPTASTNVTATRRAALWLEGGNLAFGSTFSLDAAALVSIGHGVLVLSARNQAGSGDRELIRYGTEANDVLTLGNDLGEMRSRSGSGGQRWLVSNTQRLSLFATGVFVGAPEVTFDATVATPLIRQTNTTGTAQSLTIRAQGDTSSGNGGALQLQGGRHASGLRGAVRLQFNPDDSAFEPMVELAEVVSGNRVLALVRRQNLTSTHMGANTGDGVINIAAAATPPTSNPGDGMIAYFDGSAGALVLRMPSSNDRIYASSAADTGHDLYVRAGDATGAGGTHNAGSLRLQAGSATGGSGSRNGGDVVVTCGTGATSDGEFLLEVGSAARFRADATGVAWNGNAPMARPDYTITNPVIRRTFDTTTVTLQQLAEVVGTLIGNDLGGYGLTQ